jgi:TonB family protein
MPQFRQSVPEPPEPSESQHARGAQGPPAKAPFPKNVAAGAIPASAEFDALLTEITQQALLTTRATGAAIALVQGTEMICRATTGGHAPDLGVRLDTTTGLSGACVQSRRVQICSDTEVDPRVDVEACRALGVRSILVAPLLRHETLLGVMELFSPIVRSFGERDIQTLEASAHRILEAMEKSNSDRDVAKISAQNSGVQVVDPLPSFLAERIADIESGRRPDFATTFLTGLVIGLAILFGSLLGMRIARQKGNQVATRAGSNAPIPQTQMTSLGERSMRPSAADKPNSPSRSGLVQPAKKAEAANDRAGGLIVYQNDRVVFELPPSTAQSEKKAASANEEQDIVGPAKLSSEEAGKLLKSRVEPVYPSEALAAHIQGTVGIRLTVDRAGTVQRARVFSGPPELAQAAVDAVKQWRFRPYVSKGAAEDFQTSASIDFRLP